MVRRREIYTALYRAEGLYDLAVIISSSLALFERRPRVVNNHRVSMEPSNISEAKPVIAHVPVQSDEEMYQTALLGLFFTGISIRYN